MINKRLLNEMPQAKTDIFKTVLMQWISLLCNIAFVFSIAFLIDVYKRQASALMKWQSKIQLL